MSPFTRRYPKTSLTLAAATATTAWPAQSVSDTNNYALADRYSRLTFWVENTGGANAVTASLIQGSWDAATWVTLISGSLLPAAAAAAIDTLDMETHGNPKYVRLNLTSAAGTTIEVEVTGRE